MNRKKKLNDRLKQKVKKANAKLRTTGKPRYISKAERAALEGSKPDDVVAKDGESSQTQD